MTKEKYLQDNEACPKCGSDFDIDKYDIHYNGLSINVFCVCGECSTQWTETFKLVDWEFDNE